MKIDYEGKTYTVGHYYIIRINNYLLRESSEETNRGFTKIRAKLVLKKYSDGEMYSTDYHYGYVFEYKRTWRGTVRTDEITLPDALSN